MAQINTGKVLAGGLVAGIVGNVIDYLANGVWLAPHWTAQTMKINPSINSMAGQAIASYVITDFILGFLVIWVYAAMRPRFGPGPGTAVKAALAIWLPSALIMGTFVAQGFYSWKLICASTGSGLVAWIVASCVGAMLYKEEA